MAFIFSVLVGGPVIAYVGNEVSNTIKDIVNFDYKKYFENKISNANLKTQIYILELELKKIEAEYLNINQQLKSAIRSKDNFEYINIKRAHIIKLKTECKNKIRYLKSKVVLV